VKTAPWQTPWLLPILVPGPWSPDAATGALWRQAQRRAFRRAMILIGVDDGYWREERVIQRDDGWYATTDSHRGPLTELAVPAVAPQLGTGFDQIRKVIEAPPQGVLQPFPSWIEENDQSHATAVPVVIYSYGQKAMAARGFGFDRWLWSMLELAKQTVEPPRYQE
jgi:hypothetical protein